MGKCLVYERRMLGDHRKHKENFVPKGVYPEQTSAPNGVYPEQTSAPCGVYLGGKMRFVPGRHVLVLSFVPGRHALVHITRNFQIF